MAPADVPEMASILTTRSSSSRSSTPQVNAPCDPPPWQGEVDQKRLALRYRCFANRRNSSAKTPARISITLSSLKHVAGFQLPRVFL